MLRHFGEWVACRRRWSRLQSGDVVTFGRLVVPPEFKFIFEITRPAELSAEEDMSVAEAIVPNILSNIVSRLQKQTGTHETLSEQQPPNR